MVNQKSNRDSSKKRPNSKDSRQRSSDAGQKSGSSDMRNKSKGSKGKDSNRGKSYSSNPKDSRDSSRDYSRSSYGVTFEKSEDSDIIYGRNSVMEALTSGAKVEKILIQKDIEGSGKKVFSMAKKAGVPTQALEKRLLDNIAGGGAHQGVVAQISAFDYSSTDAIISIAEKKGEKPFIIICDGIEDPHNLGAIIRSAEGAGVHGVIIPKRHSASVNGTVIKTSAGAAMHMPVAMVSNIVSEIEALQAKGLWIYGLDMDGVNYKEGKFEAPVALVVGSEGKGISRLVKEKCDFILSIPMRGKTSSLNASNAAAITMYEISSQIYG